MNKRGKRDQIIWLCFIGVWWVFFLVSIIFAMIVSGCNNVMVRSSEPYGVAGHPYECTAEVWDCCVSAPWKVTEGPEGIWYAVATITWPFWLVDEVLEVACDTVMLPADATYYYCHKKETKR